MSFYEAFPPKPATARPAPGANPNAQPGLGGGAPTAPGGQPAGPQPQGPPPPAGPKATPATSGGTKQVPRGQVPTPPASPFHGGQAVPQLDTPSIEKPDTDVTAGVALTQAGRVLAQLAEKQEDPLWVQAHLTLAQEWHQIASTLLEHEINVASTIGDVEMKQQQLYQQDDLHRQSLAQNDQMHAQSVKQGDDMHQQKLKTQAEMGKHQIAMSKDKVAANKQGLQQRAQFDKGVQQTRMQGLQQQQKDRQAAKQSKTSTIK